MSVKQQQKSAHNMYTNLISAALAACTPASASSMTRHWVQWTGKPFIKITKIYKFLMNTKGWLSRYWVEVLTSPGGTFKIFDAAKKISGAGFKFSNASADTIASNLIKIDYKIIR